MRKRRRKGLRFKGAEEVPSNKPIIESVSRISLFKFGIQLRSKTGTKVKSSVTDLKKHDEKFVRKIVDSH